MLSQIQHHHHMILNPLIHCSIIRYTRTGLRVQTPVEISKHKRCSAIRSNVLWFERPDNDTYDSGADIYSESSATDGICGRTIKTIMMIMTMMMMIFIQLIFILEAVGPMVAVGRQ